MSIGSLFVYSVFLVLRTCLCCVLIIKLAWGRREVTYECDTSASLHFSCGTNLQGEREGGEGEGRKGQGGRAPSRDERGKEARETPGR